MRGGSQQEEGKREGEGDGDGVERGEGGGGECESPSSPSSSADHSFSECNAYGNSQRTRGFETFVCRFSRAVEFIVEFSALGEVSMALA